MIFFLIVILRPRAQLCTVVARFARSLTLGLLTLTVRHSLGGVYDWEETQEFRSIENNFVRTIPFFFLTTGISGNKLLPGCGRYIVG